MRYGKFVRPSFARGAVVTAVLLLASSHAMLAAEVRGTGYVQTNLVSDLPGVAQFTNANLVNPWGISASGTSFLWTANNGTGTSSLFNGAGVAQALVVTVPPPSGGTGSAPTGTVFNGTGMFLVGTGAPGLFLFATEDGTISGWNPGLGATAILEVDNSASGAVYKGLALGADSNGPLLYATNFHAGTVDVFDGTWAPVSTDGGFMDWRIPKGYAPFGIMTTPDNNVIVTFAQQDADQHDDVAGYGHGYVDEFDADGNLLRRLISGGELDSPWGLAIAPAGFGEFSGDLLVGNFGDGRINAYRLPLTGRPMDSHAWGFFDFRRGATFAGTFRDADGHPLTIPGLWGLRFGNGANGGPVTSLYFTAGIPGSVGTLDDVESHGLFGVITWAGDGDNDADDPPTP
jgi:uncharacterized protein (TIGR03118 family)